MKKIIALLCALIMLAACCIPVGAEIPLPDEETAKEHGFTIMYVIDPKTGEVKPSCYLDSQNNLPNEVMVYTNIKLDISEYVPGEKADFYGIEIYDIKPLFIDSEAYYEKFPDQFSYVITTVDFYTAKEAKTLFADYDFVTNSKLNAWAPTDEVINPNLFGDVNGDGEFTSMDYLLLKRAYNVSYVLNDATMLKVDTNNNGEIDTMEYTLIKRAYFGTYSAE